MYRYMAICASCNQLLSSSAEYGVVLRVTLIHRRDFKHFFVAVVDMHDAVLSSEISEDSRIQEAIT